MVTGRHRYPGCISIGLTSITIGVGWQDLVFLSGAPGKRLVASRRAGLLIAYRRVLMAVTPAAASVLRPGASHLHRLQDRELPRIMVSRTSSLYLTSSLLASSHSSFYLLSDAGYRVHLLQDQVYRRITLAANQSAAEFPGINSRRHYVHLHAHRSFAVIAGVA